MTTRVFGAVDIGASSGRVMAGLVAGGRVRLETVHRFGNGAAMSAGHLRWDVSRLVEEVLVGLTLLAERHPSVESVGIDTWAVDYGLLDDDGRLLAEPVSYRDRRTVAAVGRVHASVPREHLFAVNGLQHLPFTTLFQLEAERRSDLWDRARHVVLLPDLVAYRLTGRLATERTNASTTGLLDVRSRTWSPELLATVGLRADHLPPLDDPGAVRGSLLPDVIARTGLPDSCVVTVVGSHDTASAVFGVPSVTDRFAYVSSGTWSLAGLELQAPVLTQEALDANFTNEGGVDDTVRFLRNIGGLWLLSESLRYWRDAGTPVHEVDVLAAAEGLPDGGPVVDVDDEELIPPGDMPARVAAAAGIGLSTPAAVVRCVLDSLATAYARTVEQAAGLARREVDVIHVVGGGSRNDLLCRLTADLSGRTVVAGPVEATALGNVLVQARAHGAAPRHRSDLRAMLRESVVSELRVHEPTRRGDVHADRAVRHLSR